MEEYLNEHPLYETIRTYILNVSNHELMELLDCILRNPDYQDSFNCIHTIQLDYADNHHYRTLLDFCLKMLQDNYRETLLEICFRETTRRFQDSVNRSNSP